MPNINSGLTGVGLSWTSYTHNTATCHASAHLPTREEPLNIAHLCWALAYACAAACITTHRHSKITPAPHYVGILLRNYTAL